MADEVKSREANVLKMKVEVDVSDALTAIKAVERRAREVKRTVAELNGSQGTLYAGTVNADEIRITDSGIGTIGELPFKKAELTAVPTADLVAELGRRDGVKSYEPRADYSYEFTDLIGKGTFLWIAKEGAE